MKSFTVSATYLGIGVLQILQIKDFNLGKNIPAEENIIAQVNKELYVIR